MFWIAWARAFTLPRRFYGLALYLAGLLSAAGAAGAEAPERLAKRECSKCHAFPPPGSMHRVDWGVAVAQPRIQRQP